MRKEHRTDLTATVDVAGRDQPDQRLHLKRTRTALSGTLSALRRSPGASRGIRCLRRWRDLQRRRGEWEGSPSELAQALSLDVAVNRLTRHLNVSAARLLDEYHVKYESRTRHEGRRIRLTYTLVELRELT